MATTNRMSSGFQISTAIVMMTVCKLTFAMVPCDQAKVPEMTLDTALLTVMKTNVNDILVIQLQTKECFNCDLQNVTFMNASTENCTVLVDTRWQYRVQIQPMSNSTYNYLPSCCEDSLTTLFKEGGLYNLYINLESYPNVTCKQPAIQNDPPDNNIPIYVALGIFAGLAIIWLVGTQFSRSHVVFRLRYRYLSSSSSLGPDLGTPTNTSHEEIEQAPKKERLKSLDTFRGISIIVMIFVNYKGGKYWFFNHSRWNGLTLADLVFPWFVFIMGTAMTYSFQTLLRKSVPKSSIFLKILKRSIILFGLGLLINSGGAQPVELSKFRIPGVLQRFAGTYLITATIHMFFARPIDSSQYKWYSPVRDLVDYWVEWIINLGFVAIHILITLLLEVPGGCTGYLGPGGLADHGKENCTGGAAAYIDRQIFGEDHIYQTPTCKEIYQTTVPHDPEGLLGILTSCFMCFLGLQAGKVLVTFRNWKARVIRFIIWGLVLCLIGGILCKFSKNDGWIPINKNLWSVSFVVTLGGMAFILLMFCYLTIDVYQFWSGAPFIYPGMNPIVLFIGHEILANNFPISWQVSNSHAAQLAIDLWGTVFWTIIGCYLYCQKIFISI
ncbi:hypothetical protein CHS0354_005656 [Potamilus streckersoni]|uniref:Heparan-alpha-glucosaminide N-acetyltransferase catalytic domain-containing protein n=1 Tax=Potamilus streckersoni TaxID=2493646 RepID=A0AAE0S133_9BIVA|nr:hypothetical protein CHS0354_005656 [Potamilus streckersoni]